MPMFYHSELGMCHLEIESFSSVDHFAQSGYSETLERDLTDEELEDFQFEIDDYVYKNR